MIETYILWSGYPEMTIDNARLTSEAYICPVGISEAKEWNCRAASGFQKEFILSINLFLISGSFGKETDFLNLSLLSCR